MDTRDRDSGWSCILRVAAATTGALIALTVLGWLSITIFGYGMKIVGFLSWQFSRSHGAGTLSPLRDAIPETLAYTGLGALALGPFAVAASKVAGLDALAIPSGVLYAIGSVLAIATTPWDRRILSEDRAMNVVHMDNRGPSPPEPLLRIVAACDELPPGDRIEADMDRQPIFLFPELVDRGFTYECVKREDGCYLLTIEHS